MSRPYPCVYCTEDGYCKKFSDKEVTSWCIQGPCKDEKPSNADRIRAMTDEELANFVVHRDCCPGFFTGTFSDSNRKKYGFDGRSERCEFGGDECIACWLDWLKEENKG